jgi:ZIP Zinc transporter
MVSVCLFRFYFDDLVRGALICSLLLLFASVQLFLRTKSMNSLVTYFLHRRQTTQPDSATTTTATNVRSPRSPRRDATTQQSPQQQQQHQTAAAERKSRATISNTISHGSIIESIDPTTTTAFSRRTSTRKNDHERLQSHVCCSSDDPVRELEALHQMAEILISEQEQEEEIRNKGTQHPPTMVGNEGLDDHCNVVSHNDDDDNNYHTDPDLYDRGTSTNNSSIEVCHPVDNDIITNVLEDNPQQRRRSRSINNSSHSSTGSNENRRRDTTATHDHDHPHPHHDETMERKKLMRMSINTAIAIGLHNFPEGLATFVATIQNPSVGIVLAVAIAIHNIPEGLCVALPIYYATGNRRTAFGWAILSGLSEPLAAIFGYIILATFVSNVTYGILFGIVAGMMVMISTRELLPTAHRYDPSDRVVTYSFIFGMIIIALSLVLFVI